MRIETSHLQSRHRRGEPGAHRAHGPVGARTVRRERTAHATRPPRSMRATVRSTGRHGLLATLAVAFAWGITGTVSLPAFATEVTAPPAPGSGSSVSDGAGEQSLDVAPDVKAPTILDPLGINQQVTVAWRRPVKGRLGDPFGPRPIQPVAGVNLFHRGQDIVSPCGTPIHAVAAGTVEKASWFGTYGNWVLISHGGGLETGYAHATTMLVSPGDHVREGQVIATVGTTGASTGCHLHFETHVSGTAVDPVPFMAARGVPLGKH